MTILVEINKTSRAFGRGQHWQRYASNLKRFDTIADAFEWIKSEYTHNRRAPIYVDTASRGTIQTGWIYSCKASDAYLQDWVSLSEVISETAKTAQSVDVAKHRRARS